MAIEIKELVIKTSIEERIIIKKNNKGSEINSRLKSLLRNSSKKGDR